MIVYEPNKNWLGDVRHLFRSWTMTKVIRGTAIIGLASALVCVPLLHLDVADRLAMNPTIFSLLGIVLSIILVFRTNTAYDRWWEGRKQWGALVNNCRNLAAALQATLPKEEVEARSYFAIRISNFCIAFKEHLRQGTKLEELIYLSTDEKERYRTKEHIPNHIALEIYDRIKDYHADGRITEADLMNLRPMWQSLLDILGACERIKKTPIPFSYAVYIKIFIMAYAVMLPFGLVQAFGFYTIPLVMLVFFAFLGLELMAEEIEEPFGLDCNDLPTGTIAQTITRNVFELLQVPVENEEVKTKLYDKVF